MTQRQQYRFYSFVAALYISPLQCGLQTAHAVSEMHAELLAKEFEGLGSTSTKPRRAYDNWAIYDKTIIICNALNSAGVEQAYSDLYYYAELFDLPITVFMEDMQSLNCAATAAGIVVPERFYDAKEVIQFAKPGFFRSLFMGDLGQSRKGYEYADADGKVTRYEDSSDEAKFIELLKSFRLA